MYTSVVTTASDGSTGIPSAMVLRFISCSTRRRIRLVTVVRGLRFCRCPVGRLASANLTPATGARTTRLHRTQPPHLSQRLRRAKRRPSACHSSAHGPYDPPCHPLTSPDAAASTASRPASVTTRDRPSVGQDGATQ